MVQWMDLTNFLEIGTCLLEVFFFFTPLNTSSGVARNEEEKEMG